MAFLIPSRDPVNLPSPESVKRLDADSIHRRNDHRKLSRAPNDRIQSTHLITRIGRFQFNMSDSSRDMGPLAIVQQSEVDVPWCDEFEKMINGEQ